MSDDSLDILLVDDESALRETLKRSFALEGHRVVAVPDGTSAIDRARREVTKSGEPVRLTFSEFELLNCLMSEPGRLFNRQELLRAIWSDSAYRDPRAIDVHVRHLREKLEDEPANPRLIVTVRGAGYRLNS